MKEEFRHLIVGGDSVLGKRLAIELKKREVGFHSTSRKAINISDQVQYLDLLHPEECVRLKNYSVVYFLAGITSTNFCENNQKQAYLTNFTNTLKVLRHFEETSTRIIFPSSNHVFSGLAPSVMPDCDEIPQSYYGELKKRIEIELNKSFEDFTVIRFSKVISDHLPIANAWSDALRTNKELFVKDDLCIAPIPVETACRVMADLGETKGQRLIQMSGPSDISYGEIFDILFPSSNSINKLKIIREKEIQGRIYGSMYNFGHKYSIGSDLPSPRELIAKAISFPENQTLNGN